MLLSKLEVPLALQVLCSVLGPGAPAQIFAAFFSDLTKDPYDCILLLRTCFGSRTQAVASLPCCSRRAASVVTTTTAAAVASIPGQSSGSGRAELPALLGANSGSTGFVARKASCFLGEPLPCGTGKPASPASLGDTGMLPVLSFLLTL